MLERFQEQQAAVCAVLLDSPNRVHWKYFPEGEDCTIIEELLKILKPFVQATTLMRGSSYSTIGIIAPLLYKLLEKTLAITDDDSTTVRSVKMVIYTDLQDRYQNFDFCSKSVPILILDSRIFLHLYQKMNMMILSKVSSLICLH